MENKTNFLSVCTFLLLAAALILSYGSMLRIVKGDAYSDGYSEGYGKAYEKYGPKSMWVAERSDEAGASFIMSVPNEVCDGLGHILEIDHGIINCAVFPTVK